MDKHIYIGIDTIDGWLIGEDKIDEEDFFKYHFISNTHIDVEELIDTESVEVETEYGSYYFNRL